MYIYMCVYMFRFLYNYLCTCVYMYTYLYNYVGPCIHIYILVYNACKPHRYCIQMYMIKQCIMHV